MIKGGIFLKILVFFRLGRDLENLTEEEWRRISRGEMDLNYLQKQLNPSDETALEQALLIRDSLEGAAEITGLYLGSDPLSAIAKNLYAVGLKEIYQLPVPPDLDPASAAELTADFCLRQGPFDLILTGCTEYPFDFGVTQTLLAERLALPLISHGRWAQPAGEGLQVEYEDDLFLHTALVSLPAVLSMDAAVHPYLRIATLREKMAVKSRTVEQLPPPETVAAADCFVPENIYRVDNTKTCAMLQGTEEEQAGWLLEKILSAQGGKG